MFKDENNEMFKVVDESTLPKNERDQLPNRLKTEKERMKKAWFLHQEAKLQTMQAHLNFLFKSEKFEACNVNNLYQVLRFLLPSLPQSLQPQSAPCVVHLFIIRSLSTTLTYLQAKRLVAKLVSNARQPVKEGPL